MNTLLNLLPSRALPALAGLLAWASVTTAVSGAEAAAPDNLDRQGRALSGYDPVPYFTEGRAVAGRPEISLRHEGALYLFASEKDRELFRMAPAKYLPAYGGWCATAMARGEKVEIDPTNFKVTDGRLFLFFKAFYANARKEWVKDEAALIPKADAHWKRISGR
jgi:YHS domain-containing protein